MGYVTLCGRRIYALPADTWQERMLVADKCKKAGERRRPPMRKALRDHIAKVGNEKFNRLYGLARMEARIQGGLVGMDRIRDVIAFEAAMRLSGYPDQPLILDEKSVGDPPTQECYDAANALLDKIETSLRARLAAEASR
jgi:hypothetical protein